jgi:diaminopimelate epimerase
MDIDLKEFGEDEWWQEAEVIPQITLVSMGNPHAIFVCKGDPWKIDLEKIGRRIE